MTTELISIMSLFRIGERFCQRTCGELADRLDLPQGTVNQAVGELVKKGFLKGLKTNDGLIRCYYLSDKGKAWLSMQPVKRGRVLTAVPR